jgi:rhodanese-related sulfurtransferase
MEDISVQELKERRDKGEDLVLIDVREPYEWEEFNIGGELVPLGSIQAKLPDLEEYEEKEVVVCCRSGARSAAAKDFLIKQGFQKVRNLTGGVLAWQAAFGE